MSHGISNQPLSVAINNNNLTEMSNSTIDIIHKEISLYFQCFYYC